METYRGIMETNHWCCPKCGKGFWQNQEACSSNSHVCPAYPGVVTVVNRPPADKDYKRGFIDGMRCHAHWSDGKEWVGTTGMTLKDAIEKVTKMWNYNP